MNVWCGGGGQGLHSSQKRAFMKPLLIEIVKRIDREHMACKCERWIEILSQLNGLTNNGLEISTVLLSLLRREFLCVCEFLSRLCVCLE